MRIRRDIASIPARGASETWVDFIQLVTGSGTVDKDQLVKAGPTIASLITDEFAKDAPLILEGCGPQLRVYCMHGLEAIGASLAVDPLAFNPTAGDWTLHVPCDAASLSWVKAAFKPMPRILAYDFNKDERAKESAPGETSAVTKTDAIVIDWSVKG